uniref:Uncharacterized protein n=1 Tax=Rhizophora mucronata TaxID=61149 RepID=A0A2P2KZP9_RHIMU
MRTRGRSDTMFGQTVGKGPFCPSSCCTDAGKGSSSFRRLQN